MQKLVSRYGAYSMPGVKKDKISAVYYQMHLLNAEEERLLVTKNSFLRKIDEIDKVINIISGKMEGYQTEINRASSRM